MIRLMMAAVALAAAVVATGAQADMNYTAADKAVLSAYVLTPDKLARYMTATRAMERDKRTNPALARELHGDGDASNLTQLHAAAKTHPLSMGYYAKAGLSENDAILLPATMTNAMLSGMSPALAAQYPATPAQIAFTKAHAAEMQELMKNN